jgi:hypothetical protein
MIAFVLHDEIGTVKGIVIPGNTAPDRRRGVRSHNCHEVSMIELPEIEHSQLDAQVSRLMSTHRLERATATAPARLVAKPKNPKEKG